MSTDRAPGAVEPPEVVGDLAPDRELLRVGSRAVVHLPERGDTCPVVAHAHDGRLVAASTQFDDAPLCGDCVRGEALSPDDDTP